MEHEVNPFAVKHDQAIAVGHSNAIQSSMVLMSQSVAYIQKRNFYWNNL